LSRATSVAVARADAKLRAMSTAPFEGRGRDDEPPAAARPLSVSALTRRIGAALEGLGRVSVEGEVSRLQRAASGHVYFELKDLDAKISCAIWRSQVASALRFELREGAQVVVHGKLDVYAPKGGYSLIVQRVAAAGIGALLAQFEALKEELRARGWFERKRALPSFPRTIGVVTSRDGAALQDFLRTRTQRWPGYPLRFVHTPVQGAGSAAQIARAIDSLERSGVDVICVVRGGGSLEDLWAFNELPVAEAIWRSNTPVVSGVGHETDTTLCDLVADLRAHTPTDAAQAVIPDRAALVERLERAGGHFAQALDVLFSRADERLTRLERSRWLTEPRALVEAPEQRLAAAGSRLHSGVERRLDAARARLELAHRRLGRVSPAEQLAVRRTRLALAGAALPRAARALGEVQLQRMERAGARLHALSPLAVLERGYSITFVKGSAAPLVAASDARAGDELHTRTADGVVLSRVLDRPPALNKKP
jgi:exodeoxyribonuclease VII large subunit